MIGYLRKLKRTIITVGVLSMVFIQLIPTTASADLSSAQLKDFNEGINYFNTDGCNLSPTAGNISAPGTSGPWQWTSNLQPPYYLEEFVINVLEDNAQYNGLQTSNSVTQEHVIALVAWAWAEGGNIANTGNDFNPWNMGFLTSQPGLYVGGNGSTNGTQTAFVSFDAGVEGNTIEFNSSFQNRIGTVLDDPNSTAEQVAQAIAYYDQTPGNEAWAWGPNPSNPAAVLQFNHTQYLNTLLSAIQMVRNNYSHFAAAELGPGIEAQDQPSAFVPASQLQYSGGSSSLASLNSTCNQNQQSSCSSSSSTTTGPNVTILCEAEKYQGIYYQLGGGHQGYTAFRQACPEAAIPAAVASSTAANPGPCATDCSGLVSVALDEVYNQNITFTVNGNGVMEASDGGLYWTQIPLDEVQAGDIATMPDHVEIVDHYNPVSNTLYTFGSHHTGTTTGPAQSVGYFTTYWRYIGPGSST